MSDWKQLPGDYIRPPERLADGRLRVVVERAFSASDAIVNAYLPACGSAIWNYAALTGTRTDYAPLVLFSAQAGSGSGQGNRGQPVVVLVFETAPSTATEYGQPDVSDIPGTDKAFDLAATGSISASSATLTVSSAANIVLGMRICVPDAGPFGDDLVTAVTAISGTTITLAHVASGTVSNKTLTGLRCARAFTRRYWMRGDASVASARPADLTAYYTAAQVTAGAVQQYLHRQEIEAAGAVAGRIARIYVELPDALTFYETKPFNFPGVLKSTTYGMVEPVTRNVEYTIVESYALGKPAPTAPGYEENKWAKVGGSYTPSATGVATTYGPVPFRGYLSNGYSASLVSSGEMFTGYNNDIAPIEVTAWSINSTDNLYKSNPENWPTGRQVVTSNVRPWVIPGLGVSKIWQQVDESVIFPSAPGS